MADVSPLIRLVSLSDRQCVAGVEMTKSKAARGNRAHRAILGFLLTMGLAAFTGSEAAEARHMTVSLNGNAAHAADAEPQGRADLQRMFKARCPGRVERLLSIALPAERPDFKAIAEICTCATASIEALPPETTPVQFRTQAAQAALTCSKNTITTHNELRTRKALGPYLSAQGLDAQQVATFSQCAAITHWKNTVDATQDNPQADIRAWWGACTEQVGRKGLPEPQN